MSTITFLSSGKFQLSASVGSASITLEAWGAGGSGNASGTGGSGGGYVSSASIMANATYDVIVGVPVANNGGGSSYVTRSLAILVRAAGGQLDGTVSDQAVLQTGSVKYLGGLGGVNNTGYAAYDGSGGGSSATTSSNGVNGLNEAGQAINAQTLSSFYYRNDNIGGSPGTASGAGAGGAGAYYNFNGPCGVRAAGAGSVPGGGGGGSYDYGTANYGAGGAGKVVITGIFA